MKKCTYKRRTVVRLAALTLLCASRTVRAAPTRAERRLNNRLELWHQFAERNSNLRARYQLTRHTSILQHPLVATGTLVFVAPDRLVFFDDSDAGAKTQISGGKLSLTPRNTALAPGHPEVGAAGIWLAARLVTLFAPGTPQGLIVDADVSIPRGAGMRLALNPPKDSPVRRDLRSMQIRFDPVTGAVVYIEVEEARGDRLIIGLSDHRQNVDPSTLADFLTEGPLEG